MTQHNHPPKPPPPAYESDLLRRLVEYAESVTKQQELEASDEV